MTRRGVLMMFMSALAACASRQQPMGPTSDRPRLDGDRLVAFDGARLPIRHWSPPDGVPTRAVVVALHGFNDYSKAFEGAGRLFAGRGVAMCAYDQRGFGGNPDPGVWAGRETLVADAGAALVAIADAHPGKPLFLMGESMGGAVVIDAITSVDAARPTPPIAGAILSAPAVWGFQVMSLFPRLALRGARAVLPGWWVTAPPELGIRPTDNDDVLRDLWEDPLVLKGARVDTLHGLTELMGHAMERLPAIAVPTLALYGGREQVIPDGPVAMAIERLTANPQVTVKTYPNGHHMLFRDRDGVVVLEDMAHWVDQLTSSTAVTRSGA